MAVGDFVRDGRHAADGNHESTHENDADHQQHDNRSGHGGEHAHGQVSPCGPFGGAGGVELTALLRGKGFEVTREKVEVGAHWATDEADDGAVKVARIGHCPEFVELFAGLAVPRGDDAVVRAFGAIAYKVVQFRNRLEATRSGLAPVTAGVFFRRECHGAKRGPLFERCDLR